MGAIIRLAYERRQRYSARTALRLSKMHVHLVFVAKCRRESVYQGDAIDRPAYHLRQDVCADFEAQLVEIDGEDDHVHLLVELPAQGRRLRRS
jgi:REP element-mobilizing transposase RayT